MRSSILLAVLLSTCCFQLSADAQDPRQQRRRAFIEDLLNGLIESQLDPNQARAAGQPQPGQPQASHKMLKAREQLRQLSEQAGHLIYEFDRERRRETFQGHYA